MSDVHDESGPDPLDTPEQGSAPEAGELQLGKALSTMNDLEPHATTCSCSGPSSAAGRARPDAATPCSVRRPRSSWSARSAPPG